jgi:hypothetical protein
MPASNVPWGQPLTRLPPFFPGQWGVRGSDNKLGLRSHTDGAVFYVNPNHPDRNDSADGTNPDQPLATIAAALTKCLPFRGDVIAVMANNSWQYGDPLDGYILPVEESVIVGVPGVRIVGISQSSSTGVVWQPATNGGTCITVNALDVSIEGFLFTEGSKVGCNAIVAVWNGTTAHGDNLTVRNCVFDHTVDTAISLEFVWYANIHHNVFWECDAYGIYSLQPGSGNEFLIISDNVFHNVGTSAMSLVECSNCHIFGNSIYNATALSANVATNMGINTTAGAENQVYDNYFSCVLPVAANGDWNDLNTSVASDAWINNHCTNGPNVTRPT